MKNASTFNRRFFQLGNGSSSSEGFESQEIGKAHRGQKYKTLCPVGAICDFMVNSYMDEMYSRSNDSLIHG